MAIHGAGARGGLAAGAGGEGGVYRAPCTALIAPSATELLQLPRWISADKKGALDRAGIQLADGCRSPAWGYSAPPEPDLIWMRPPSQPIPAASDGSRQLSSPTPAPRGTRVPQILLRLPVPARAVKVPRNSTHRAGSAMPTRAGPRSVSPHGWSPVLPSGATSHRACGGSSLQHRARPRKRGEHVSRTRCIPPNK